MNDKRAYYEFGKFISDRASYGTVDDTLEELAQKLVGTAFTAPKKSMASKLRKTYERYIKEFGFSIDQLENISALDLYRAQSTAFGLVNDKASAQKLIDRLNNGEDFTQICRDNNLAPKTPPEYLIEQLADYVGTLSYNQDIFSLVKEYGSLIRNERGNQAKAEELFLDFNKILINMARNRDV